MACQTAMIHGRETGKTYKEVKELVQSWAIVIKICLLTNSQKEEREYEISRLNFILCVFIFEKQLYSQKCYRPEDVFKFLINYGQTPWKLVTPNNIYKPDVLQKSSMYNIVFIVKQVLPSTLSVSFVVAVNPINRSSMFGVISCFFKSYVSLCFHLFLYNRQIVQHFLVFHCGVWLLFLFSIVFHFSIIDSTTQIRYSAVA